MKTKPITLRINRLGLKNFRGFESCILDFDKKVQSTVFVGVNGSGKSSVLDSIAILISWIKDRLRLSFLEFYPNKGMFPAKDDIRNGSNQDAISIKLLFNGNEYEYLLSNSLENERVPKGWYASWDDILKNLQNGIQQGNKINLPLIVYYRTNRYVLDIPLESQPNRQYSQLDAYENAFDVQINFHSFFKWYRDREDFENQEYKKDSSYVDQQLKAIREALTSSTSLKGYTTLAVDRSSKPECMVVSKRINTTNKELKLNQLSDGEKCLIAMIADIGRRLAIANPGLENPLEGHGVVLIDEIELHLHPAWQRTVIPDLEKAFPNIQFIVTTHSPQVISQVKPESLYILEDSPEGIQAYRPTDGTYGRDSNQLLENIFGIPGRPEEIKKDLNRYFQLIDKGDLEKAKKLRKKLEKEIGPDDPEFTRADVLIRRREILKK